MHGPRRRWGHKIIIKRHTQHKRKSYNTFQLIIMMSSSWVYLIFRTYYQRLVSTYTHIAWRQAMKEKTHKNFFFFHRRRLTFSLCLLYLQKRPVDLWCMNQFFYPHFSLTQLISEPKLHLCLSTLPFPQYFASFLSSSSVVVLFEEWIGLVKEENYKVEDVRMKSVQLIFKGGSVNNVVFVFAFTFKILELIINW